MDKITDLAAWRAAHPAKSALPLHAAIESILSTNLRIAAALQRMAWQAFWRL